MREWQRNRSTGEFKFSSVLGHGQIFVLFSQLELNFLNFVNFVKVVKVERGFLYFSFKLRSKNSLDFLNKVSTFSCEIKEANFT